MNRQQTDSICKTRRSLNPPNPAGCPDTVRSPDCQGCRATRLSRCSGSGAITKTMTKTMTKGYTPKQMFWIRWHCFCQLCHCNASHKSYRETLSIKLSSQRGQHLVLKIPQQVAGKANQDRRPQPGNVQSSGFFSSKKKYIKYKNIKIKNINNIKYKLKYHRCDLIFLSSGTVLEQPRFCARLCLSPWHRHEPSQEV